MLSELDASRSGNSSLASSSTVDGVVIKTSIQMGRPARGTQTSGRVRVGSW